jgi:DNA-binding NtrC family response regulator
MSEDRQWLLVVDGEVLVRHALADYLRHCGYSVVEAASSDEALSVLQGADVAVAAVLCDVSISGSLNGFQLRQWMREHRSGVHVMLAGNLDSAASAAADLCEQGPDLTRPYDPQGVVDYIKRLLAQRGRASA